MYELDLDELELVSGGYTPGLDSNMPGGKFGYIYGSDGNFPQLGSQPCIQYDTSFMHEGGNWNNGHFETSYNPNSMIMSFSDYPYLSSYLQSHPDNYLSANQSFDLHFDPTVQSSLAAA